MSVGASEPSWLSRLVHWNRGATGQPPAPHQPPSAPHGLRPGYQWEPYLQHTQHPAHQPWFPWLAHDARTGASSAGVSTAPPAWAESADPVPYVVPTGAAAVSARSAALAKQLASQQAAATSQGGAASSAASEMTELVDDEGVPITAANSSQLAPLIPREVAWLIEEAEEALANATGTGKLDLRVARLMATQTSVAYCTHKNIAAWNCSRCGGALAGFELNTMVYDLGWDLFAYTGYNPGLDAIVVAFRGTDSHSLYNWVENMRYWRTNFKVPFPGADGSMVHTGFFASYNMSDLAPNITIAVRAMYAAHPKSALYVTGHSMGAAMAHIAALSLKFALNFTNPVHVFTFGSPRVGNDKFEQFFLSQVAESWRFTHNRDIVPSVPLQVMGFHHPPTEVWLVDFQGAHIMDVCDGSGEDIACHNSVCWLGLCTSIADHMHYLGADMFHSSAAPC